MHLIRGFWGGRYGEEAARAVLAYGFDTLHLTAITAGHHPDHRHSRALMERLGLTYTHLEPWGTQGVRHPFYRLELAAWRGE